jgi:hypothetical protein
MPSMTTMPIQPDGHRYDRCAGVEEGAFGDEQGDACFEGVEAGGAAVRNVARVVVVAPTGRRRTASRVGGCVQWTKLAAQTAEPA